MRAPKGTSQFPGIMKVNENKSKLLLNPQVLIHISLACSGLNSLHVSHIGVRAPPTSGGCGDLISRKKITQCANA